jgi:hypothetical protein
VIVFRFSKLSLTEVTVETPGLAGSKVTARTSLAMPYEYSASVAVHCETVGHAICAVAPPDRYRLRSMTALVAPLGEAGSKVTSSSPSDVDSSTVHWLIDGQASEIGCPEAGLLPIIAGGGLTGERGSKVTARPLRSMPVHWLLDGHATRKMALPTNTGVGRPTEPGSNVNARRVPSIAVHCVLDGHATAVSQPEEPASIVARRSSPGELGSNVIWRPISSTVVHCRAEGQSTALSR